MAEQIVISTPTLAMLLVAGAAVWWVTRTKHTHASPSNASLNDVSVPATQPQTANSLDVIRRMQEAEAVREAAWRRADKVRELNRDYDRAANEAKQVLVQLNQIDSDSILPADIVETVKAKHVQFCADNWGIFSFNAQNACNHLRDDGGRWQREAETMHAERKKATRKPLQVKLDNLQSEMQRIELNLKELGESIESGKKFHRVT